MSDGVAIVLAAVGASALVLLGQILQFRHQDNSARQNREIAKISAESEEQENRRRDRLEFLIKMQGAVVHNYAEATQALEGYKGKMTPKLARELKAAEGYIISVGDDELTSLAEQISTGKPEDRLNAIADALKQIGLLIAERQN